MEAPRCRLCDSSEDVAEYLQDAGCGAFDEVYYCDQCYCDYEGFDGQVKKVVTQSLTYRIRIKDCDC